MTARRRVWRGSTLDGLLMVCLPLRSPAARQVPAQQVGPQRCHGVVHLDRQGGPDGLGVIAMIGLLARRHAERANQLDQGAQASGREQQCRHGRASVRGQIGPGQRNVLPPAVRKLHERPGSVLPRRASDQTNDLANKRVVPRDDPHPISLAIRTGSIVLLAVLSRRRSNCACRRPHRAGPVRPRCC